MFFARSHFSPWRPFFRGFHSGEYPVAFVPFLILIGILCATSAVAQDLNATVAMSPTGGSTGDRFGEAAASIGDVNDDTYDDFIVGAQEGGASNEGQVYIFFGGPAADDLPDLTITGTAANHDFGFSVAGIGDINGDSIDDFIVGAPVGQNDTAPGAAYIFFGSDSFPATLTAADADVTINGEANNDEFGCSVTRLGDFDNDGSLDIAVGADQRIGNFGTAFGAGRVYVFLGISALTFPATISASTAELVITGVSTSDDCGFSISGGGNLDNDDYDDLIIGAPRNIGVSPGAAYIVRGLDETSITTPLAANAAGNVVLSGSGAGRFGYSVAMSGSIDGDVYDDVVVGALLYPSGGSSPGAAFVFLGSATLPATIDAVTENDMLINGEVNSDRLGVSVAGVGDLDGDGNADFMVGASRNDAGGASSDDNGRGYVFLGESPLPSSADPAAADLIFSGPTAGDALGWSVGAAGDFDGDTYADVFVGAPGNSSDTGQSFVYSLTPAALGIPTLTGEPAYTIGTANTLVWSDESGSGASEYEVERADDVDFTTNVVSSGAIGVLTHEFTGLTDGQIYYYRVRSGDTVDTSDWSAVENSTQDATAPVSSAGPLDATQAALTFDVPYTATDATSGVASVELFFQVDAGGFSSYGTFSASPISFTAAGDGAYDFYTVGLDNVGNGEVDPGAAQASTTVTQPTLTVPTLTGEPAYTVGTANTLVWSDESGSGASEYEVERADDVDFTTNVVSSGATGALTYEFTGLTDGQIYYYRVRSGDTVDTSDWSAIENSTQDATAPVSSAGPLDATQAALIFDVPYTATDATSGVASVELFFQVDAGGYGSYGTFSASPISFTAAGDGAYDFYTVGLDNVGNGEVDQGTAQASTTVTQPTLTVPTLTGEPTYTLGTANTLIWSDESGSGATEYEVERADDVDFTTSVVSSGTIGALTYEFTGLADGQIYYYRVRSGDTVDTSDWSAVESSTQDATAPVSSAGPLDATQAALIFDVPYTATDATSGVASVELFFQVDAGGYSSYGTFSASPISFTAAGDGAYDFYTVGLDNVGNGEVDPGSAQASTTVDTALEGVTLVATPGDGVFGCGETVTVDMIIDDSYVDLMAWQVTLTYDETLFGLDAVELGAIAFCPDPGAEFFDVDTSTPGTIVIAASMLGCSVSGPGNILTMDFSGLLNGTAPVTPVSVDFVYDGSVEQFPIDVDPVSITYDCTGVPPNVTNPGPQASYLGQVISLQVVAVDPDDDTLTYSALDLPLGLSIDEDSGLITGTIDCAAAASYDVTVSVTDGIFPPEDVAFVWTTSEPLPALANLAVSPNLSGNDSDGTINITVTWDPQPADLTVDVYRKGFGNYPEYDDAPGSGSVPSTPADPAAALADGWELTTVAASGDPDETTVRDYWYYVAFVVNGCGDASPVSNQTEGTLNYHLGDIAGGAPGEGDNLVDLINDITVLATSYGLSDGEAGYLAAADVGPTTDMSLLALPLTDSEIQFEDLILFGINFANVSKFDGPDPSARNLLTMQIAANANDSDLVEAVLWLTGDGLMQGLSVSLDWDPEIVEAAGFEPGGYLAAQGGNSLVLSPTEGAVDATLIGRREVGLAGAGHLATVRFRRIADGDPGLEFAKVLARDAVNDPVELETTIADEVSAVPVTPTVTRLYPAYPNPFNPQTRLAFDLARDQQVRLSIYSVDGRLVRTLLDAELPAGRHELTWKGQDQSGRAVPSGIYFTRFVSSDRSEIGRMTLIR